MILTEENKRIPLIYYISIYEMHYVIPLAHLRILERNLYLYHLIAIFVLLQLTS